VSLSLSFSLRPSGAPGQAWLISLTERSQTCELASSTRSRGLLRAGNQAWEAGRSGVPGEGEWSSLDDEGVSPSASEPDSASIRCNGGGQPSRDGEACHLWSTQEAIRTTGPPGVVEEGARRKISRGTWETRCGAAEPVRAAKSGALWPGVVACDGTGVNGSVARRHRLSPRQGGTASGESITR